MNKEYKEAIAEVLDILSYTEKSLLDKIPREFINFLNDNKSKDYISTLDQSKEIKYMQLNSKTQAILGFIYLKYWASEEEKIKFELKLEENEQILENEFKIAFTDDMFNKTNINSYKEKEKSLLQEYKKESLISKILKKILNVFKRD